jgi:hypothetical protein
MAMTSFVRFVVTDSPCLRMRRPVECATAVKGGLNQTAAVSGSGITISGAIDSSRSCFFATSM